MADTRSLRDLFDDLTSRSRDAGAASDGSADGVDPAALLRDAGHGDLPPDLVAEALSSYAGTAPLPVAEHLSPFVSAWAGGEPGEPDAAQGLDLLLGAATATEPVVLDDPWAGDDAWAADGGSIDDLDSADLDSPDLDSPDLDSPDLDSADLDSPDVHSAAFDATEDSDGDDDLEDDVTADLDGVGSGASLEDGTAEDEAADSSVVDVVDFGAMDLPGEADDVFGHGVGLVADFGAGVDLAGVDLAGDDPADDGFDD
jgi:hypothetical protein